MNEKIITRIAPSPTGFLHIGTARTALFNFLFSRKNKGIFLLRLEDSDDERSKKEFDEDMLVHLVWLGISADNKKIPHQSENSETYKKYLLKMIEEGSAYISKEEPKEEGQRAEVIRFKNPNEKVKFVDIIRGEVEFDTTDLGDFVIARSLDEPLYHLAVVVDDFLAGVTHIIRGEDHISNTPRQILIQEAIGAPRPVYAHLPLILSQDRSKMSKRHGAVAVADYQKLGYLPSAIINYLALLGWNPGTEQEIFSMDELIAQFDLSRVQKGGAIFNIEKLDWVNKEHLKALSSDIILKNIEERIFNFQFPTGLSDGQGFNKDLVKKLAPIIFERIHKWSDIDFMMRDGELDFFFHPPKYDSTKLLFRGASKEKISENIKSIIKILENISEFSAENIKKEIMAFSDKIGSRGEVLHPMRFALSGRDSSPDPFSIAYIIGKNETISRLKKAI